MATLSERQSDNYWKKKTWDCPVDEYFRRAPHKLKMRVKDLIVNCGHNRHNRYLPSSIYESYGVDFSHKLCNDLIDHYTKGK